ncbi:uncharacterized protein LOC144918062 isoform X3 [Branchiostoma floridae x Branchiostoma belcheri]
MASGVAGQIKEEFLVCQICFEDYLNPKVLPCQHTFCKTCLENMVAKMGKLTCPNCRLACQLPRSGVEGLPTSFFVNKLRSIIGNAGTNYRREDEPVTTSSYSLDYRGESVPVACGRESPSLPTANRAHGVVSAGDTAGAAAQQTEATPAGGQSAQNTRSRQAHSGGDMAGAAEQQTEATPAGGQSAQNTRSRQAHSAGNTAGAAAQQTEATPAGGRSAQNTRSRQAHSGGDTAGATAQQTGATPAGGQSARNTRSRQAHVPVLLSSGRYDAIDDFFVRLCSTRYIHPDRVLPILSWLKEQDITTAQDLHDNWEDVQNMVDMTNAMKQHITEALGEISHARR